MNTYYITDVRADLGDSGFLLHSGKTAILYDSGFAFSGERLADNIEKVLGARPLDCIFLTHSHYDHALGAAAVKRRWPAAKIVTGERTAQVLEKPSALAHMRQMDRRIAAKRGIDCYEDYAHLLHADMTLADGEEFSAGEWAFTYLALPGHTRCSGAFYLKKEKLLLGCETLGVSGEGEEVYPACLVGYEMSLAAIRRVRQMDIRSVVVPHRGLLSAEKTARYLACCGESTEKTAELILSVLRRGGSREDAVAAFAERYYRGSVPLYYPREAMELNTGIMVDLMARELLGE